MKTTTLTYPLTYPTSLAVLRLARREDGCTIQATDHTPAELPGLASPDALPLARHATDSTPHVLVDRPSHRTHRRNVMMHVCPRGALDVPLLLVPHPTFGSAFVEHPALSVLHAAHDLEGRVRMGTLERQVAVLRMVELVDELCGSYSRDPTHPRLNAISFFRKPVLTCDDMQSWARGLHLGGTTLAQQAAPFSCDDLASPVESLLELSLCLPPRYGGIGMPRPLDNASLPLKDSITSHQTMRPDLWWPAYDMPAEYNGDTHDTPESFREDLRRINDYQTLGITTFVFTKEHFTSVASLDEQLLRLVHHAAHVEGAAWQYRIKQTMRSAGYQRTCQLLIDTFYDKTGTDPRWS